MSEIECTCGLQSSNCKRCNRRDRRKKIIDKERRERIATAAMAGLCARPVESRHFEAQLARLESVVCDAVYLANNLIAALDKDGGEK